MSPRKIDCGAAAAREADATRTRETSAEASAPLAREKICLTMSTRQSIRWRRLWAAAAGPGAHRSRPGRASAALRSHPTGTWGTARRALGPILVRHDALCGACVQWLLLAIAGNRVWSVPAHAQQLSYPELLSSLTAVIMSSASASARRWAACRPGEPRCPWSRPDAPNGGPMVASLDGTGLGPAPDGARAAPRSVYVERPAR